MPPSISSGARVPARALSMAVRTAWEQLESAIVSADRMTGTRSACPVSIGKAEVDVR